MRGVAALAVVTFHANLDFGVSRWLPSAYLAVDMFFVLSGFVLAHAYEHRFKAGMTPGQFMAARLVRLYPLYILAIALRMLGLLTASFSGHDVSISLGSLVSALPWNLFFLPAPPFAWNSQTPLFPLDAPAWSLLFELLINLAYVLTWRALSNRMLVVVAFVSAVCLLAWLLHFGALDGGWNQSTILVGAARVLYSFPLGILLYRMRDKLRAPDMGTALPLIATALLLAPPWSWGTAPGLYSLFAITVISPVLVAIGACCRTKTAFSQRICIALGDTSYGVYVLHASLTLVFSWIFSHSLAKIFHQDGNVMTVFFVISLFIGTLLVDRFYDIPVRNWLTRRILKRGMSAQLA